VTPTETPTASPTATVEPSPTSEPTASPEPSPTASPTLSPTAIPSPTPTPTNSDDGDAQGDLETPMPSPTRTANPTARPTPRPTIVPINLDWDAEYAEEVRVGDELVPEKVTVIDEYGHIIDPNTYEVEFIVGGENKGKRYVIQWEDLGKPIEFIVIPQTLTGYVQKPIPVIPELIKDDHFVYMQGYPEGDFRPIGNMTRAEVAVMFARLIVQRTPYVAEYKGMFSDVPEGTWCTLGIEYLASLRVMIGREGAQFDPSAPITRAEFAAVASRFDKLEKVDGPRFSDVTLDYWFYDQVNSASVKGWIQGYEDGEFRPFENIRRVEVVTIVNRMLEREFDETVDKSALKQFSDLTSTYWGYANIMEATNAHDYKKDEHGKESWTTIRDEKVQFATRWRRESDAP